MVQRVQTAPVQGYGQTRSAPSARPTDAYGGFMGTDTRPTAFATLANAFSTAGGMVAGAENKKYLKAEAEKERLRLKQIREDEAAELNKAPLYAQQWTQKNPDGVASRDTFINDGRSAPVAARIAQTIGEKDGEAKARELMAELLANSADRVNPEKRDEVFASIRSEITKMGAGRDFYGGGALSAANAVINEVESSLMQEQAANDRRILEEGFAKKVSSALTGENPTASLIQVDNLVATTSNISNVRSKEIIVDEAIRIAITNKDDAVLNNIPDSLLNNELKAKIAQARGDVANLQWTDYQRNITKTENDKKIITRSGKTEINAELILGNELKLVDLMLKYPNNPEVIGYALQMQNFEANIKPENSKAEATKLRSQIIQDATGGDVVQTEDAIIDSILARTDINAADKEALIADVPRLFDGIDIFVSPRAKRAETTITKAIDTALKSNVGLAILQEHPNLLADIILIYQESLQSDIDDILTDGDDMPKGKNAAPIIKEAQKAALEQLKIIVDQANP